MRVPRAVRPFAGLLALLAALAVSAPARADIVTEWNQIASDALQAGPAAGGAGQGAVSIAHLAMVHGAIYDAVNAIEGCRHEPYVAAPPARRWYSKEAAAATAAYGVLVNDLAPLGVPAARLPLIKAAYDASLAAIPDGQAKKGGIATGNAAAAMMIAARVNDGRFGAFRFTPGTLPGEWRPELPMHASDQGAWLKDVEPFVLRDPSRFRGRPPHDLTSRRYAREFAEVEEIGSNTSATRTPAQTDAAKFWGTANATQTWSTLLRVIAANQHGSVPDNARMFARVYTNAADALIVTWVDKARYSFWRPITAIREAAADGNPDTDPPAAEWLPLINTPPYPDQPSGLAALGGAAVATLQDFYGTDHAVFGATTTASPPETQSFSAFSQAIDQIVDARVWSGIHFRFADDQGARIGRRVARYGNRNAFR
jgi:hypothetical protein